MENNTLKYHRFLDEMVAALHSLNEDDLAQLAAACSTAESRILAAMANNYPSYVNKPVDSAIRVD